MNKHIKMTKSRWNAIRKKGLPYYLFFTGFCQLGVIGGGIFFALLYLKSINYQLVKFSFKFFVNNYLMYFPIAIFFGIIIAFLAWSKYEDKFGPSDNE
ncbi:hypothetical protein [Shewanella sedimentimangrovi]|uniref:Chloride channel protein n=1 Tax=Shewanella sedimentimangrovi TaxID=2814293 RepID=A0ABX7QYB8_9GAMM|nr:hypothetical protein [Shewanella sedimentimangrovi]QSX36524.1 hypothetical protein JYB85_14715 [Shewanella sedimentimangrovi]